MINLSQKENLNKTIMLGDKVRISDPCYDVDTWCAGTLENVLAGTYNCFEQRADCDGWGNRVASIEVRHADYPDVEPTELQDIDVGVDSGQCGIYDLDYFIKAREDKHGEDKWYNRVCDTTGGYFDNPAYVPFTKTTEYKASIMALKKELDTIKEKYPELNTEEVYVGIIEEYHDLEQPKAFEDFFSDLSDVVDVLKKINETLSGHFETKEKTEAEEGLSKIEVKYEIILHEQWNDHHDTIHGHKKIWRNVADTLDNKCLVSSSGYGDGSYHCFVGRNDAGQIVSIKIDYFYYGDEEEEEE